MLLGSDASNFTMAIIVFSILFLAFCLLIWEKFIYPLYFPAWAIANLNTVQQAAPAPRIPDGDIPTGVRLDTPTTFVSEVPITRPMPNASAPSFRLMQLNRSV
jgi:hypothetical protein